MSESSFSGDGFRIVPFGKGRNAIQSGAANDLVRALNALGKMQLAKATGKDSRVIYSDGRIVFEISATLLEGIEGAITVTELDGSPSIVATEVRFPNGTVTDEGSGIASIDTGAPLTVKEQDGTPNVSSVTEIRLPNGSVTDHGSGAVSIALSAVEIKRGKITSVSDDYVTVDLWDETANAFDGASVTVAKPYELRNNATGTEWSIAWTYSYASAQERTRTATGYAATKQRVFPDYKANDEILIAFNDEHTGVESATEYVDLNVDARRWRTETEGCDDEGEPVYSFVDRSPWVETAIGSNFA